MAAGVVALPVALGGVVALPEQFQQVAEVEGGSAPHHTHNFRVSRSAGADLVVARLLGLAARIPHSSAHHPRQSPEPFFSTPEASTGKDCFLLVGHQGVPSAAFPTRRALPGPRIRRCRGETARKEACWLRWSAELRQRIQHSDAAASRAICELSVMAPQVRDT